MSEKLILNNVDITKEVTIYSAIHEMFSGERSDSLVLRFNDMNKQWDKWNPGPGTTIVYRNGGASTGIMYLYATLPEEGYYTIKAFSMPLSGTIKMTKSWERVHLSQLGAEIAERNGLTYENYGMNDIIYEYIAQENETDFKFLGRVCRLESAILLVYDGKLIIASEKYLEGIEPTEELSTAGTEFEGEDNSSLLYGSALVECGSYRGLFKTSDNGRILTPDKPLQCTSNAEAVRFASGLLRDKNKGMVRGSIKDNIIPALTAGTMINIKNDRAASWSGAFFISKVRHDYGNRKSTIFFRKPLEGY
jgi:hypothetical protein